MEVKNTKGQVSELELAYWLFIKWRINYLKFTRAQKNKILCVYLEDGFDGLKQLLAPVSKHITLKKRG